MNLEEKTILVTGGSGLIGHNLLLQLVNKVKKLYATEHNISKQVEGVKYFKVDLLNQANCNDITREIDIIFHCAADSSGAAAHEINPTSMAKNNIVMNFNLLESAYINKVKQFIWFASTTGYPDGNYPMNESEMFIGDPFDKYFAAGWMKRYTEKLCQMYATKIKNPMTCIVFRPTNIYGPHDKIDPKRSHVLAAFIRKVVEKQDPIQVWGDGTEIRDVLYVDDIIDAVILSAKNITSGFHQFNIGYGEAFNILYLLDIIKIIGKHNAPIKFIPGPRMIPVRRVSIEKIKNFLNWQPKVSIDQGITKTYNWIKTELESNNNKI